MAFNSRNRRWKLSNGLFMRLALQSTFTWVRKVVFSTPEDIFTIYSPEQIEIQTFTKKIKDRVQTETDTVPKIYQDEFARPNCFQTLLALASVAIDASEFSFRNFNWFPLFHRKLNFAFSVLVSLFCHFLCLWNLTEIIFSLFKKNNDFASLHFADLPPYSEFQVKIVKYDFAENLGFYGESF
jgi:hypothetical protein